MRATLLNFFALALVATASAARPGGTQFIIPVQTTAGNEAVGFAGGLVEGFFGDAAPDVGKCIQDGENLFTVVAAAFKSFEEKTPAGIKEGLKLIGEAFEASSATWTECGLAVDDLKKFESVLGDFRSPMHFIYVAGKSLLVNHAEISSNIEAAVTSFKVANYNTSGKDVGTALAELLVCKTDCEQRASDFLAFVKKYDKTYLNDPAEMKHRQMVYALNMRKAAAQQKLDSGAEHGETVFSDLTSEEFQQKINPQKVRLDKDELARNCLENGAKDPRHLRAAAGSSWKPAPASWDWVSKGAVTPVRNQAMCGSCWAFSTAENIEGQWFLSGKGNLTEFSPQELVDCSTGCSNEVITKGQPPVKVCNSGCGGGWQWNAYMDVVKMGGIETEKKVPYAGIQESCGFKEQFAVGHISNYTCLPSDEAAMAEALVNHGPLAIALNADFLQTYQKGILNLSDEECDPTTLDHALLVVGYDVGTDDQGEPLPYWRVKNSWDVTWGEKGYFRIARGKNTCGVANAVSTSIIDQ